MDLLPAIFLCLLSSLWSQPSVLSFSVALGGSSQDVTSSSSSSCLLSLFWSFHHHLPLSPSLETVFDSSLRCLSLFGHMFPTRWFHFSFPFEPRAARGERGLLASQGGGEGGGRHQSLLLLGPPFSPPFTEEGCWEFKDYKPAARNLACRWMVWCQSFESPLKERSRERHGCPGIHRLIDFPSRRQVGLRPRELCCR